MSDYKAILKHSSNYLIANIATKALLFISIPIYTRLLSVEEYGIVNVFMSTISVAAVLLTMNSEVAISRYYFDTKEINEFKRFVGTSINLATLIMMVTSSFFLIFIKSISEMLSFSVILTISILPVALYSIINSVFEQIYNPLLQSKKIAIVSSVKTYLAFALSLVFILLLKENKYMGYVWGTILAMVLLAVYLYRQIKPYYISCLDKKHIKYILSYCLPYLPYSLSGVILAQFGRLFISSESGFEKAGVYSFASNISMIMMVLIMVIHQAWNPYYFRYMNENDRKSIDGDYDLIWRGTLIIGIGICLFGQEIGWLMGASEYWQSLYILPLLVTGYVLYQWAYVYMRNCGYAKKTIWNAIAVISGGVLNVVLSYILIPQYKELGVAIAFCVSYLTILIVSFATNRYVLKVHAPSFKHFNGLFCLYCLIAGFSIFLYFWEDNQVFAILIKIVLFIVSSVFFMYNYRREFKKLILAIKKN